MKPINFSEETVIIAKNQPEYQPLPSYQYRDLRGQIVCCWGLTWRERFKLLFTGRIWHHVYTFNMPLQPQLLSTDKPKMGDRNANLRANTPQGRSTDPAVRS